MSYTVQANYDDEKRKDWRIPNGSGTPRYSWFGFNKVGPSEYLHRTKGIRIRKGTKWLMEGDDVVHPEASRSGALSFPTLSDALIYCEKECR